LGKPFIGARSLSSLSIAPIAVTFKAKSVVWLSGPIKVLGCVDDR
jgi:hypothetical protein